MSASNYLNKELSKLYEKPSQAQFLHPQAYVEGCLLGACACPEIPLPDVWLGWVIQHHNRIESDQQADYVTGILFAYFKQCLASMHNGSLRLPKYAVYEPQSSALLQDWCLGLLTAHSAVEHIWQNAWIKMQAKEPEKAPALAKDLKHCLLMFTTFAEPEKAIQGAQNKADGDKLSPQKMTLISKSLGDTLLKYVAISNELATFLPNQFETFQQEKRQQ